MKKDLDEMTIEELCRERNTLLDKHERYEKIGSGFLKAVVGALGLAVVSLGIIIGDIIFECVDKKNIDKENEEGLSTYLATKYQEISDKLDAKEIDVSEFSKLKELADKTYKEEYYTVYAPEETKVRYQTHLAQDFALDVSAFSIFGAAATTGLVALGTSIYCDNKKNQAEEDFKTVSGELHNAIQKL